MKICTACPHVSRDEDALIVHFARRHLGNAAAVARFADKYGIRPRPGVTLAQTMRRLAAYREGI